jgi:hypothetical protein
MKKDQFLKDVYKDLSACDSMLKNYIEGFKKKSLKSKESAYRELNKVIDNGEKDLKIIQARLEKYRAENK